MTNAGQRVPGRRWMIGCLLGVGILINYIDRVGLSAATPELTKELGLTATDIGLLGSAFFWTYSLLQVPGGMVLDRFGVTTVGRCQQLSLGGRRHHHRARQRALRASPPRACCSASLKRRPFRQARKRPATGFRSTNARARLRSSNSAAKFSNVIGVPLVAYCDLPLRLALGFRRHGAAELRCISSPTTSSIEIRARIRSSPRRSMTISLPAAARRKARPRRGRAACSVTSCATARCGA